jgi:hypothetical protein
MKPKTIKAYLDTGEGRAVAVILAVSLMLWAGASAATAAIDLGAAVHDATCPEHRAG